MSARILKSIAAPALLLALMALLACSGQGGTPPPPPPPGGVANVTVSGSVTYEDREYGIGGYTGTVLVKPARYARVDIVDASDDNLIATGATNASGIYSLNFTSPSSAVYARVVSTAMMSGGPRANVREAATYAVAAPDTVVVQDGYYTLDMGLVLTDPASGAFNILDVLVSGAVFVNSVTGIWPPQVSAIWSDAGEMGTYYCPQYDTGGCSFGSGIYVLGHISDDSDTYDDDVIWHEYAHFLAFQFARDDSPGGYHTFEDKAQEIRLSWSEGWADHFPGAVKRWLAASDPSALSIDGTLSPESYTDNYLVGPSVWMDLASPGDTEPYMYATNEISVSKLMLDTGRFFGADEPVWDAFRGMADDTLPATLETFWDSWLANVGLSNLSDMEGIFADRRVYYTEDAFEPDSASDAGRLAVFNASGWASEVHYLYQDSGVYDSDIIAFDATAGAIYNVQTYCVKNGVDTVLRVLDADGVTVLAENDNRSYFSLVECPLDAYTGYSSYIAAFAPLISNTYFIEVVTNPAPCYSEVCTSTARYGTYKLGIREN